jgi:hypothetical protein
MQCPRRFGLAGGQSHPWHNIRDEQMAALGGYNVTLEASCDHPVSSRLTGTSVCLACMPHDSVEDLPRPLGEQLVEGFTRILGTPREPGDQARQLAQFILLEFDIMRRSIR